MSPILVPLFLFFMGPKQDENSKQGEGEDAAPRKKLLSASERLRVPTPAERLLQD
jgi:hypothetical protein